jgi:predicted peroxiredoxin
MKKILLSGLLLASIICQAQIELRKPEQKKVVGQIKMMGTTEQSLSYVVIDEDTVYYFLFRNQEYKHLIDYSSVEFSGQDNTLEKLYKILLSVFSDENIKNKEYKVNFKLGNTEVIVSSWRMMGITAAMFFTNDGYCYLTEKQIKKLFGRY